MGLIRGNKLGLKYLCCRRNGPQP